MLYHTFATQEEIDQEYNPCFIVKNTDELIESYFIESQRVLREYSNRSAVDYGPTPSETLDIFSAKKLCSPIHIFSWRLLAFVRDQGCCVCGRRVDTKRNYGGAG